MAKGDGGQGGGGGLPQFGSRVFGRNTPERMQGLGSLMGRIGVGSRPPITGFGDNQMGMGGFNMPQSVPDGSFQEAIRSKMGGNTGVTGGMIGGEGRMQMGAGFPGGSPIYGGGFNPQMWGQSQGLGGFNRFGQGGQGTRAFGGFNFPGFY